MPWELRVAEGVIVDPADEERRHRLDPKVGAVLAYLALEGPTSRATLADLAWPDAGEAASRNALAQALGRLRKRIGAQVATGDERLALAADVVVDVARDRARWTEANPGGAGEPPRPWPIAHARHPAPALEAWAADAQARLLALWRDAAAAEARAIERRGDLQAAVRLVERRLDVEPADPAGIAWAIRLHAARGDRAAARRAYERGLRALESELGVTEEPVVEAAWEAARRGSDPHAAIDAPPPAALPAGLVRPPVVAGRDDALAALEAGWRHGGPLYVTGPAGIGKTHVVRAFLAGKGRVLWLESLPGHRDIPFAAAAHLARQRLAAAPGAVLEDWVRRELARLLPELADGAAPPSLDLAGGERLRFYQAYGEMVRVTSRGFVAFVSDDVQHYDDETVALGAYLTSQLSAASGPTPRFVILYRADELPSSSAQAIERLVNSGRATRVALGPLDASATHALLRSLEVPTPTPDVATRLHAHTGGHPLFLLELVSHLLELRAWPPAADAPLPGPPAVVALVRQRLERLSPVALRMAQAAAVLGGDYDAELVETLLGLEPAQALEGWVELEAAQLLTPERFRHDLVWEAVRASVPAAAADLLRRRARTVRAAVRSDLAAAWSTGGWLPG